MMRIRERIEVQQFAASVCEHVKTGEMHKEIKAELYGHIEDHVETMMMSGASEEDAIRRAIQAMGDPTAIGKGLHAAHRPRTEWGLLILVLLLAGTGIFMMFNVDTVYKKLENGMYGLLDKQLFFAGTGIAIMAAFWFFDYRRLKRWSELFFAAGLVLLAISPLVAIKVNGVSAWIGIASLVIYVPRMAIILLIIGLSGMRPAYQLGWKEIALQFIFRGLLPVILFMQMGVYTEGVIYMAALVAVLVRMRIRWTQLVGILMAWIGLLLVTLYSSERLRDRLLSFMYAKDDPLGDGYYYTSTLKAIQDGDWWGNGFSAVNDWLSYIHTDTLLPYFIYCFGWVAGGGLIAMAVSFFYRTIKVSKKAREPFGQGLTAAIAALFMVQISWSVLMIIGLAPFTGVRLPFVSFGGTNTVTDFLLLGLLLSVYRRKDIIPRGSSSTARQAIR
ncbi:hypothetical protein DNH61_05555 [Paenibacillus sambharensis]|uniref:FtsW/RodA/SpoVE family cell cycle protein n=1 Tax=Paenibacillus sambharensis TaxID=1803190 RepID=A0A2W1LF53_9BACL|nr:FtsW/RodA/SpoVE family cell cycle protein [Paenibacillus sambharensis]PZD96670.1 hypothetical protein DNH61_05555 [Paenibacillus sambharensis]